MSLHRTAHAGVFVRLWTKAFDAGRRKDILAHRPHARPQLECLEDRLVPAVINVNSLADTPLNQLASGQVTLRDAIQIANTNGDTSNTINLTLAGTYNIRLAGTPGEIDNQAGEFAIFTNVKSTQSGLSLTIQNTSGGNAVINGNKLSRVFDINPNNVSGTNLGTVTINGVTIENGLAQPGSAVGGSGGGIRDQGPVNLTLNGDMLTNNSATGDGGGLFIDGGALTLTASTFAYNTATVNGGGIELQTTAPSIIANSTLVGNTALNSGGNGGGIDAGATFTNAVTLLNDTITNNYAANGGGIYWAGAAGSTFSVENTILAQNTGTGIGPDANNAASTFTDLGGNLIGVSGAGSGNTGFTAATSQTGTVANPLNPMVAALAYNGGPNALKTEALLPGSPAIGKGVTANAPSTDARGVPRINGIDVGAFQFANATLQVNISAGNPLNQGATEPVTVTVTNTSNNPLPADNSTLTVTASSGLNIGGTQSFTLGALAAGQSQSFIFNATGAALGVQTLTASVTSPDTNPATVTSLVMVHVNQAPPTTPQGALTLFAFGFGPTGIDLFEIDSVGGIFAVPYPSGGAPIFLNTMLELPLAAIVNNQLLALVSGSNGQLFLIDIIDPFAPGVLGVVLAALHM